MSSPKQAGNRRDGKGGAYMRFDSVKADGSIVVRLRPPADHVALVKQWLAATVEAETFRKLRLTWRHNADCPRLTGSYGPCRCRPELFANGQRLDVPDSVFGN